MPTAAEPSAEACHREVSRLLRAGDLKSAQKLCEHLTTRHPHFGPGWHSASFIALCRGDVALASEQIQRALAQGPDDARYLLQHARCLSAQQRLPEAIRAAEAAEMSARSDAPLLDALGSFHTSIGEHRRALECYSKAIAIAPARALYWFNRAAVRRFLAQLTESEQDYDRAIELRPDDHEAWLNRSELRKQTAARNHVEALKGVLAAGVRDWRGQVQIHHALAKEYEDLGQHDQSWDHLSKGARIRRGHLQYDIQQDLDTVDWIIGAFPASTETPHGCGSAEPIFIVGLPRSGTTLVERILASHSRVLACGELNHFAAALVSAAHSRSGGRTLPRAQLIAATRDLDFAALGEDYLKRARPAAGTRQHFTDKMPLNYLYCGLIHRALPAARIVHVTRHPMASCYAMYKTLFKDGYPFSYDLDEVARYYAGYRRLMDHWHRSMPGVIHDISYERLVREQEPETRRLLAACGLDWEPGCLEFHRNPTATTTASASQVRRPLYDSSILQWRHYEEHLRGLRDRLLAAGIDAAELSAE